MKFSNTCEPPLREVAHFFVSAPALVKNLVGNKLKRLLARLALRRL